MARKKKSAEAKAAGQSRDGHIAYWAYQLGYDAARLPMMAAYHWVTADINSRSPDHLLVAVQYLTLGAEALAPLLPDDEPTLAAAVKDSVGQAWEMLHSAWGGPAHRARIEWREASEPEHCGFEPMLIGSPMESPKWPELGRAVKAYTDALPPPVAAWVRLGDAMAAALDPDDGQERMQGILSLRLRLAEMQPQPLLDGVDQQNLLPSFERLGRLHEQILGRLGREHAADGGQPPPASSDDSSSRQSSQPMVLPPGMTKEALALGLLATRPGMTVTQIAYAIRVSRTSVYAMPLFAAARRKMANDRAAERGSRPRASKDRDRAGNLAVDGVDEREPWQDVKD